MPHPPTAGLAAALLLTALPFAANAAAPSAPGVAIDAWLDDNLAGVVELYKELHQTPELSYEEEATGNRLAKQWRAAGFDVTQGVGGHGVVGVLENGDGPTLMLRCDTDALPVIEDTGVPYASRVRTTDKLGAVVGVMHACGHDIHMANMTGVVRWAAANRDSWSGTLMVIAQPAEERGAGAKAMLADGLFARFPRPDYAVALHVAADYPAGQAGYLAGYSQANVDSVDIAVKGRGGHGAYPHTTADPVVIAAKLVLDLQTIVSRELDPIEPAVITVGSIHGGTKHNIISDECKLQLTVRSYSPQVRQQIADAIIRKAKAAAASANAPEPEVDISEGTPSLYNDPKLTERVAKAVGGVLGPENMTPSKPTMGGEDFSRYGIAGVPICMFKLGTIPQERLDQYAAAGTPPPSLHSAKFYPAPKPTLATGIKSMTAIVRELLPVEN
ncbi:N-acetyldiaminopimelate deacetylase [Posidoniimonas polymericola]|uniref:N-acetyldiaminopimelate deacetylase n=1 Tax=Posidoniimonas polymericola TaxID=2528002 RepID=A0A5C5ZCY6_9BACT|nr:amidohydrolase [Posidoniimonas polymericola]TWT85269.1 N-acetyldiaminopimelate deacetylase [Posidoniimonas polymericola]